MYKNFIFFGSPRFAKIILENLLQKNIIPSAVICNSDKPFGRKGTITPPPTKTSANNRNIPVLQFEKIDEQVIDEIRKFINKDFFGVVAAYSNIIPKSLISLFDNGIIGIHPSILPKYRGSTPIQTAILNGEKETGVTLYILDEKMDHGDVISVSKCDVSENDSYYILEEKLAKLGAELFIDSINDYLNGKLDHIEQNHNDATFTKKIDTEGGFVDLKKDSPISIHRRIMALSKEPGVYMIENGKRIKLLDSVVESGIVRITKVVEEGKKPKDVNIELG